MLFEHLLTFLKLFLKLFHLFFILQLRLGVLFVNFIELLLLQGKLASNSITLYLSVLLNDKQLVFHFHGCHSLPFFHLSDVIDLFLAEIILTIQTLNFDGELFIQT